MLRSEKDEGFQRDDVSKKKEQKSDGLFSERKPVNPVSRATVMRYRKKGFDVGPKGRPDYAKVAAIHERESKNGKAGTRIQGAAPPAEHAEDGPRSAPQSHYWDERYRKAKALDMERSLAMSLGTLLDAKQVEEKAFNMYRMVRDALMNIPERIAGEVAADVGVQPGPQQDKIYQTLRREVHQILTDLSNESGFA